jgi:hypothetical protein
VFWRKKVKLIVFIGYALRQKERERQIEMMIKVRGWERPSALAGIAARKFILF